MGDWAIVPVNVRTQHDALIAKAFLLACFTGKPRSLEKIHLAFNNPSNCHLFLDKAQQQLMSQILFDISNGKIVARRDLAWTGENK